jgi:hypothetical protein
MLQPFAPGSLVVTKPLTPVRTEGLGEGALLKLSQAVQLGSPSEGASRSLPLYGWSLTLFSKHQSSGVHLP